jgi:hypothetical protein
VSWPWIVLLALAVAVVVAGEWPGIAQRVGSDARSARKRERRKSELRVIEGGESDEFVRSVQADLDALPTIDEPRAGKPRGREP